MHKQFICIKCPKGCIIDTEYDETTKELLSIEGNTCPRGKDYVIAELTAPKRPLTTTIRITGAVNKVVPVMTSQEIDKSKMFEVMAEIAKVVVESPVKRGDVLISNVANSGADMIAQTNM